MKSVSSILIFSFLFLLNQAFAGFKTTPNELKKAVNAIESFDEGKQFLNLCQSYGKIDLKWKALGANQSTACWIGHERVVILNASRSFTEGRKISSILFELNNSLTHNDFIELNKLVHRNKISKNDFVRQVEMLEYQNVLKTRQLLEKGVELGIFPEDCLIPIAPNFDEHFKVQISSGHSEAIAKQYDQMIAGSKYL
jgi:hypothetical protein